MIDSNVVIRTALLANAPLVALTGQRIWPGRSQPIAGYQPADGGAIAFRVRGGGVTYNTALQFPSVQFKCWAVDMVRAQAVYRALFDALRYPTLGIRSAEVEALGQAAEEENGWPFVLTFYTIWLKV